MSGGLVNGTMGMVYNIVWEDRVKDLIATMQAMVLVAVNIYAGSTSIVFNSMHMVLVVLADI